MADAMDVSYLEFERRALTFEALADPIGAAEKTERNRLRRTASIHQESDGSWGLHAKIRRRRRPRVPRNLLLVRRPRIRHRLGRRRRPPRRRQRQRRHLRRTEAQRRADALLEMARAAAACPPGRQRPLPTVNFLLDGATAASCRRRRPLDPLAYRDVTARSDRGHRVEPAAIIGVSLWAMIRRVVTNSNGVVIELGRTSRLFTGYAREAVMLLEPTCIWPGCDHPHTWCHADHLTSWNAAAPPTPTTAAHCAAATTTSKNSASPSPATTTATGTSPAPTAPRSAEPIRGSSAGRAPPTHRSRRCPADWERCRRPDRFS
jgi:hypothetical protein